MKFLPLVWGNLGRKRVRTAFTALSIFVSFAVLGLLAALEAGLGQGAGLAGANRLMTIHKISLIQPLPLRYYEQIERVEGVAALTHQSWFGGYYRDERASRFAQFAVDPETFAEVYGDDFEMPREQLEGWFANRSGAIVGRKIAEEFGWEVGDTIPITPTIWQRRDGQPFWDFKIEGIYSAGQPGADESTLFFHYDYLNEASNVGPPGTQLNMVGQYVVQIEDPDRADQVAAEIDALFANSEFETKTSTEKAFLQGFANQLGNIGAIASGIGAVVLFTLLLVAGNTMAQSVRERTAELAVLKTFGFSDLGVMGLVLAESMLLTVAAGGAGLLAAKVGAPALSTGGGGGISLPDLWVPNERLALGAALVVAFGVVAAGVPAWQALRLRIVDALRSA